MAGKNKVISLFSRKKTEEELEDDLNQEGLEQNLEEIRRLYGEDTPVSVIMYNIDDSGNFPVIKTIVLVEEFLCRVLPEVGSIIWIADKESMRPFRCERFDFFQNGNAVDSIRIYVVVRPALPEDVIKTEDEERRSQFQTVVIRDRS